VSFLSKEKLDPETVYLRALDLMSKHAKIIDALGEYFEAAEACWMADDDMPDDDPRVTEMLDRLNRARNEVRNLQTEYAPFYT
jgi:hypothetical protein